MRLIDGHPGDSGCIVTGDQRSTYDPRLKVQQDEMPVRPNRLSRPHEVPDLDDETCFFEDFSGNRRLERLSPTDLPTRHSPLTLARRTTTFDQ